MSCYNPLKAYVLGIKSNGKKKLKIFSPNAWNGKEFVDNRYDGKAISENGYEIISIPCGKCVGCRLDYSRQWANRMVAEAMCHESNVFLTLTYDDYHLPEKRENSPIHSLNKRHLQLFMKRLRKRFTEQKIRFYACGEYGSQSMRPHYHLILFGLEIPDREILKINDKGDPYFTSKTISELWTYGYHIIAPVNWETCAYVARYVMKKRKGVDKNVYDTLNYEPEFVTMSRRSGIGRDWYDDNKEELFGNGSIPVPSANGARPLTSCRYFDTLLEVENPELFESIKAKRQERVINDNSIRQTLTDKDYNGMLKSAEINKESAIRSLERSKV